MCLILINARYEMKIKAGSDGNYFKKVEAIKKETYQKFLDKSAMHLPIHDVDLRRWALRANTNLQSPIKNFKASIRWIQYFKKTHGIVDRKITKIISTSHARDHQNIMDAADRFVKEVKERILKFTPVCTFNTDQSGFLRELHSEELWLVKVIPILQK